MAAKPISLGNTYPALIIIDMQQGMLPSVTSAHNNLAAEENMGRLLARWRQLEWTIVHVKHRSSSPQLPFWPHQSGFEFQAAFTPQVHELVVEKNVPDAFLLTPLAQWLREHDINQLIIVGVSTNISVESSARTASNLGFTVSVVSDASFAFNKTDYSGSYRCAADVHAMSLANLAGEFASIVTTQDILSSLSGHLASK